MHFNLFNDHLSQVIYSHWMSGALVPRSHVLHNKLEENATGECIFCVDLRSLNNRIICAKGVPCVSQNIVMSSVKASKEQI